VDIAEKSPCIEIMENYRGRIVFGSYAILAFWSNNWMGFIFYILILWYKQLKTKKFISSQTAG